MNNRSEDYRRLINCTQWRHLRNAVIAAHPLCEECSRKGRTTAAAEVHHRIPLDKGRTFAEKQRLAYSPANLQPLCRACHVRIHAELSKGSPEERQNRTLADAKDFWEKVAQKTAPTPGGGVFYRRPRGSEISPRPLENARGL